MHILVAFHLPMKGSFCWDPAFLIPDQQKADELFCIIQLQQICGPHRRSLIFSWQQFLWWGKFIFPLCQISEECRRNAYLPTTQMVNVVSWLSDSRNDFSHSLWHYSGFLKVDSLRLKDISSIKNGQIFFFFFKGRIEKEILRAILRKVN